MRMRRRLVKTYALRRRIKSKDAEGGSVITWSEPVTIRATTWQASGRVLAEMYGERLAYMRNMEYEGTEEIKENDGLCIFVAPDSKPDYRVVSVNANYHPTIILLEALH